jgi:hypothetical protein
MNDYEPTSDSSAGSAPATMDVQAGRPGAGHDRTVRDVVR